MTPDGARVAALVLAGGASRRMGTANKLLMPVEGQPMLLRVIEAVCASGVAEVWVVTGHDAPGVLEVVSRANVSTVHNPEHASGLAASIRVGLRALPEGISAALICLGDMPWLTARHLDLLIDAYKAAESEPICVPTFQGRRGNPLLWPARHFPALNALEGDVGGRALLESFAHEVIEVPMPDAAIHRDVDTPADVADVPGSLNCLTPRGAKGN